MRYLRLVRSSVSSQPDPTRHRRASDHQEREERFRYPAEEVWEVSCRTDEERQPAPAPESRAS